MSRVIFLSENQQEFLSALGRQSGLTLSQLARICDAHPRTLSDWARGKTKMTLFALQRLCEKLQLDIPGVTLVEEYAHTSNAGRLGGIARNKKYGNPGTAEGRSKGGRRSGPAQRQKIHIPEYSEQLAEAVGIILGDGGVSRHQVQIALDRVGDEAYSRVVQKLFYKIFGIHVARYYRENVISITLSSANLVDYLAAIGVGQGNKVRRQVDIPDWVKENAVFARACLRGLIDTDGCVYSDRHLNGERVYRSPCIAFSNHSQPLLRAAEEILTNNCIRFTSTRRDVKIRKRADVVKFLDIIGFSNAKHLRRIQHFLGEVA